MVEESLGDWILLIKLSEHFDIGRFGIHLWFSIQVPALNAFNEDVYKRQFLNRFSSKCRNISGERIAELRDVFEKFVDSCSSLPLRAFYGKTSGKFNILLFEAVFAAQARSIHDGNGRPIESSRLDSLKEDTDFTDATQKSTTDKANVLMRLKRAQELVIE